MLSVTQPWFEICIFGTEAGNIAILEQLARCRQVEDKHSVFCKICISEFEIVIPDRYLILNKWLWDNRRIHEIMAFPVNIGENKPCNSNSKFSNQIFRILFHTETGYLDLLSKRCLSAEAAEQAGNSAYFRRMNCMLGYIKLMCLK